ncbi:hypothetical protein HK25_07890 [Acetobacter sp. DsW_059]|nr:hypothetical protein HK25_07890 [Acetobacter sp. DsW_059]
MRVGGYASNSLGTDMADIALFVFGIERFETLASKRQVECLESSRSLLWLVLCLGLIHEESNNAAECIRRRQIIGVRLLKDFAECTRFFEEAGKARAAAIDKVWSGVIGVNCDHLGYGFDRPVLPNHTSLSKPNLQCSNPIVINIFCRQDGMLGCLQSRKQCEDLSWLCAPLPNSLVKQFWLYLFTFS